MSLKWSIADNYFSRALCALFKDSKKFFGDSKKCAGRVGLYIKDTIKFSVNQCSKICLLDAEHLWVDIQTKRGPIAIGVVYRHPDNLAITIDKFNKEVNELFLTLNMSNSKRKKAQVQTLAYTWPA